jgi:hypothetical protein
MSGTLINNPDPSYVVLLDCCHLLYFPPPAPRKGDQIYCRTCTKYRKVSHVATEYVAKCYGYNCKLTRRFGVDKEAAIRFIDRHRNLYPHHNMRLLRGGFTIEEFGKHTPKLTRYLAEHPEHHADLGALIERAAQDGLF